MYKDIAGTGAEVGRKKSVARRSRTVGSERRGQALGGPRSAVGEAQGGRAATPKASQAAALRSSAAATPKTSQAAAPRPGIPQSSAATTRKSQQAQRSTSRPSSGLKIGGRSLAPEGRHVEDAGAAGFENGPRALSATGPVVNYSDSVARASFLQTEQEFAALTSARNYNDFEAGASYVARPSELSAAPVDSDIEVIVRNQYGAHITTLEVNGRAKIGAVKMLIRQQTGISSARQQLLHEGVVVQDALRLRSLTPHPIELQLVKIETDSKQLPPPPPAFASQRWTQEEMLLLPPPPAGGGFGGRARSVPSRREQLRLMAKCPCC